MRMSKLILCTVALVAVGLLVGTTVVTDVYAAASDDNDSNSQLDAASESGQSELGGPANLQELADDVGIEVKDLPAEESAPQLRPSVPVDEDGFDRAPKRPRALGGRGGLMGRGGRGLMGGRGGDDERPGFGGFGGGRTSSAGRASFGGRDRQQQHMRPRHRARTVYETVMEPVPPEQIKAEQELHRALLAFKAGQDDRKIAETRIREQLQVQFDHDLKRREEQLKEVEERVTKLRQQLDRRRNAGNEIIRLRVQTLLNEASGLGFPGFETPTAPNPHGSEADGLFYPAPNDPFSETSGQQRGRSREFPDSGSDEFIRRETLPPQSDASRDRSD